MVQKRQITRDSEVPSKRLTECSEELFYQLVEKLSILGEIKYEHLFVDGTKIEANANKYSFVWRRARRSTRHGYLGSWRN